MVADARVAPFDGDLDDYARALLESRSTAADDTQGGPKAAEQRRAQRRAEAEHRNRLSPLRAEVRGVEEEIGRLELELAEIEGTLSDPLSYAAEARQALAETLARQRSIRSRLDELEARWLAVSEALQSAERAG
jgi:ATP-binding cassette subfamily F protein 3